MRRATTIVSFLILLLTSSFSFSQTAEELGLVIRDIGGNGIRHGHGSGRMVIENTGKETVIAINPSLGYGTGLKEAKFCFRGYDLEKGEFKDCTQQIIGMSEKQVAIFKSMAPMFEGDRPSENMTLILKPGESFTFLEFFDVDRKVSTREDIYIDYKSKDAEGKEKSIRLAKTRYVLDYVELKYEFSFLPYSDDPDLLEKMSQRWRRYGRLPVGTNGTYTITSEPIK